MSARKKRGAPASVWILSASTAAASLLIGVGSFINSLGALRACAALRDAFPAGQAPEALERALPALRRQLALTGVLTLLVPALVLLAYYLLFRPLWRQSERAAYDAEHDALTGLFNRAAFERALNSLDESTLALVLIDVDRLKTINDKHGHAAGDMALRRVAEVLRGSFRAEDYICRIGGDEFAVVMTRVCSAQRAAVEAKLGRIREALSRPEVGLPTVSVSAGIVFGDRTGGSDSIFRDADAALYRAKNSGRNRWAFY